jgi:hypothetical protein
MRRWCGTEFGGDGVDSDREGVLISIRGELWIEVEVFEGEDEPPRGSCVHNPEWVGVQEDEPPRGSCVHNPEWVGVQMGG